MNNTGNINQLFKTKKRNLQCLLIFLVIVDPTANNYDKLRFLQNQIPLLGEPVPKIGRLGVGFYKEYKFFKLKTTPIGLIP